MNLPNDVARCDGKRYGTHAIEAQCSTCLRRTDRGEGGYVAHGPAPIFRTGAACPQRIPPEAQSMSAWQPIETAPKDGTTVIEYRPTTPAHIEGMYWADYGEGRGAWHWAYDGDGPNESESAPTHWMPLPSPPEGT